MKKGLFTLLLLIMTAMPVLAGQTNTSGPWGIDASGFRNLSTALSAPITIGRVVVVSKIMAINNKMVSGNRQIKVIPGGRIDIGIGKTLAFAPDSNSELGTSQTFGGSLKVTGLKQAAPDNFGVNVAPGTTDMSVPIQSALTSALAVYLGPTTYKITASLNMLGTQSLIGIKGRTIFNLSGTDGISVTGGAYNAPGIITGITFDGLSNNPPVSGGYNAIKIWDGTTNTLIKSMNMRVIDNSFQNIMGGVYLRTAWQTTVELNLMANVPVGVQVLGLSVYTKILNNVMNQYNGSTINKSGSVGVLVKEFTYSGSDIEAPQDVTIENNQIYTYESGVQTGLGQLIRIIHNMIDVCTLYGIQYQTDSDLLVKDNWIGITGQATTPTTFGIYAVPTGTPNTDFRVRAVFRDNNVFGNSNSLSTASTGYAGRNYGPGVLLAGNTFSGFMTADVDLTNIGSGTTLVNNNFNSTHPDASVNLNTTVGGYVIMRDNIAAKVPIYMHPANNTAGKNDLGHNTGGAQSTWVTGKASITSGTTTTTVTVPMGSNAYVYPVFKVNSIVSTNSPVITAAVTSYGASSTVITLTSSLSAPVGGIKIYYDVQGIWYGDN